MVLTRSKSHAAPILFNTEPSSLTAATTDVLQPFLIRTGDKSVADSDANKDDEKVPFANIIEISADLLPAKK